MRLLGISGSLQARSSNKALLDVAGAVSDIAVTVWDGLADIPAFNPDTDPAPASVDAFRALVQSADGLIIATPEYAFGVPGALKNALDWLVGTGELYGKRVVVLSGVPSAERGANARADLERTLRGQGAEVLVSTTIAIPTGLRGHEIDDPAIREAVSNVLDRFDEDR